MHFTRGGAVRATMQTQYLPQPELTENALWADRMEEQAATRGRLEQAR